MVGDQSPWSWVPPLQLEWLNEKNTCIWCKTEHTDWLPPTHWRWPPRVMPSTPSLPLSTAGVSIVTFHLLIWLKAVDITKQANLNVIARLGGFHQLKSYLGLMGNIMQNSGLLEGIQLIYPESTTANHKAIRAHLLINAVVYQHIMKLAFTDHEE